MLFAANWKMHIGPGEARQFLDRFLALDAPRPGRTVAFFPPAVSIEAVAARLAGHDHLSVGAQDVHWEPQGAFTGAISVALARGAGAAAVLVGHSERRHVFGETDAETGRKVQAVLAGGLQAVLCVGEQLIERDEGKTRGVVERQLRAALAGVEPSADLVIAYEPVWAIGTGRNASPGDANEVHGAIREVLADLGLPRTTPVLYGGSVKPGNAAALLAESEIDGVLVGGASLDPESWAEICAAGG
ncbi:MAG TPA: triose-phosphate isomerase [Gemmatimonadales bacterium]|nr:triose-phosphate isomerase [Gemmatimonadales bacterium]HPF60822.1 triose-phosphate isomerase [Gemmatimonadales bacterium]HRX18113.1 triose-phosphate isomerase [Gemmatimonadales bacterium]